MNSVEVIRRRSCGSPMGTRRNGVRGSLVFAGLIATANAATVLDHIHHSSGNNFSLLPNPSPSQVFTDSPTSDSMVIEDFTVTGSELRITRVSAVFRALAGFITFQDIIAYRVSVFDGTDDFVTTLDGNVANLSIVAGSGISVTQIFDGSGTYEYGRVDIDLEVILPSAGQYWFGISPVVDSSRQFFLQSATPLPSGGLDARFANPGNGFGIGFVTNLGYDAAYAVTAVPEPSVVLSCATLLGFTCARRRRPMRPLRE